MRLGAKTRYFIFFYKCQNRNGHTYGQYGTKSGSLPSYSYVAMEVAGSDTSYEPSSVNITGFNEVTKYDYDSFFDKD